MNIAFVRGPYLNNFELQSYYSMLKDKNVNMIGFSSLNPKHKVKIKTEKFPCPIDLPDFPKKLQILNRLCFGDAMYLFGLESKLKNFDIAHVRESYFAYSSQAIKAKKINPKLKVLVTCSETIVHNHETITGRKRLKKNVLVNADHFHTISEKAKKCLMAEGVSENKITVIYYGVDLGRFKPKAEKKNKKLQILFIGRLEEQKGVNELMEAWGKLKQDFDNIELKIVGKGPLASKLESCGLKTEFYAYEKIPQLMNQPNALVLPSKKTKFWEEYFGMVLVEAMACGLPIVSTDCGVIPEIVGGAGIITKQGNSKSLYNGLKKMIEDEDLRKKYSKLGLVRARKHFDSKKQAEKLKKLYFNILN